MIEIDAYCGHGCDGCAALEPMVMQACGASHPGDRLFAGTRAVVAVHGWHPGPRLQHEGKSWMPAFAAMTVGASHHCNRHAGGAA
jgi:hypothetical protein